MNSLNDKFSPLPSISFNYGCVPCCPSRWTLAEILHFLDLDLFMTEGSLNNEIEVIYPTFQLDLSPPLSVNRNNGRIYARITGAAGNS